MDRIVACGGTAAKDQLCRDAVSEIHAVEFDRYVISDTGYRVVGNSKGVAVNPAVLGRIDRGKCFVRGSERKSFQVVFVVRRKVDAREIC